MITPEIIEDFKERMHITHNDDRNIKQKLTEAAAYVRTKCGPFTFDTLEATDLDTLATSLVFERTRFAYNDALEYFEGNFASEITGLGVAMALAEVSKRSEMPDVSILREGDDHESSL